MAPTILLDDGTPGLAPLDDLRSAADIRTGVLTTRERVALHLELVGLAVPNDREALIRERLASQTPRPTLVVNDFGAITGPVLVLNARAPLAWRLAMSLKLGQCMVNERGFLVAALIAGEGLATLLAGDRQGLSTLLASSAGNPSLTVMDRPWHVRAMRDAAIADDLQSLIPRFEQEFGWPQLTPGAFRQGTHALGVHRDASVWPMTVFDTSGGPILIGNAATIRPGAVLVGPCAVLEHATVLDHATIRPGTVVGPWCKVGGEVWGTIFQGHANKAHEGFVGDSFVGEWANLGAGTTTSNLLNTYGEVLAKATPSGKHERTGQQFLGAIVGDHVKTAIGTRLLTGCIVHTGAMLAESKMIDGCVPAFSWCTDAGRKPYRVDKFMQVMEAAMARRQISPGPAYSAKLRAMAEQAAPLA